MVVKTNLSTMVFGSMFLFMSSASFGHAQTPIVVVLSADAQPAEHVAAEELIDGLHHLYPSVDLGIGIAAVGSTPVYLGTAADLPRAALERVASGLADPDSFVVETFDAGRPGAIIAGANPRATVYAVDALLEKLGYGFFLSYNTIPSPVAEDIGFGQWHLSDSPIATTRIIFDWHNFLSSCSTWNLEQWQQWITQASRLRFNTIMVHAYGNNPMMSFTHNGVTKPTGYLSNTAKGRDWGTEHVEDVRTIVGADGLFDAPVFGAEASKVPEAQTVQAATHLMQQVFQSAAKRGMNVTFALDVDTEESNPQNIITTLPVSARMAAHGIQLANPDTPEGYAYYRSEISQLLSTYPEITTVALWFRGSLTTAWRSLQPEDFPEPWRRQFQEALQSEPALKKDPEAPSLFALGKIAMAFRKALDETHHEHVMLATGSWRYTFLSSADAFMPKGTILLALDASYEFQGDPAQEAVRKVGRNRAVVPIVWAQHDDREYAGRSYVPLAGLASTLQWSNSAGLGVIHWTTRPFDLFFKNVGDQVWSSSRDEDLQSTASNLAAKTFGMPAQSLGTKYLMNWIHDAPAFGRETSNNFIDQTIDLKNAARGVKVRLALLAEMEPLIRDSASHEWLRYYQDWEHYVEDFYEAQDALQRSQAALKDGDTTLARDEILKASPETAIEQYARTIQHGGASFGEKGILISLNLRWLPHFTAQRQAVGLEPIQFAFKPTVQESLAQSPGRYTFAFDASHRMTEILGEAELGTPVATQDDDSDRCRGGIVVSRATPLSLPGFAGAQLRPGAYDVTFHSAPGSQLVVEANGRKHQVDSMSPTRLDADDGTLHLTLSAAQGAVSLCGITLMKID